VIYRGIILKYEPDVTTCAKNEHAALSELNMKKKLTYLLTCTVVWSNYLRRRAGKLPLSPIRHYYRLYSRIYRRLPQTLCSRIEIRLTTPVHRKMFRCILYIQSFIHLCTSWICMWVSDSVNLFLTDKLGYLTVYPHMIYMYGHDPGSALVHNSFALAVYVENFLFGAI